MRTRSDVVRVAGRLFAARGYHGTSMRDLGDELGLLGSSLYAHIGSKTELLEEIVDTGVRQCVELAATIRCLEASPDVRLRRLIVGHAELVSANLDLWTTFVNEYRFLCEPQRSDIVQKRDDYQAAFREVLEDGVQQGVFDPDLDVRLNATLVLSTLNAMPGWFHPEGGRSGTEVGTEIADVLMQGLLASPAVTGE